MSTKAISVNFVKLFFNFPQQLLAIVCYRIGGAWVALKTKQNTAGCIYIYIYTVHTHTHTHNNRQKKDIRVTLSAQGVYRTYQPGQRRKTRVKHGGTTRRGAAISRNGHPAWLALYIYLYIHIETRAKSPKAISIEQTQTKEKTKQKNGGCI